MALALILFFGCAASNVTLHPFPASPETELRFVPRGPSPRDLPDACAIVASEAASRLAATGAWTRIIHLGLKFGGINASAARTGGHAVTVWVPPTCSHIFVYDEFLIGGAIELNTTSRDCKTICAALQRKLNGVTIIESHFVT